MVKVTSTLPLASSGVKVADAVAPSMASPVALSTSVPPTTCSSPGTSPS